jgi:hypothetical protein
MAPASFAEMKPVRTRNALGALAFAAPVFRHGNQALEPGAMNAPQPCATVAALFHSFLRYNPICVHWIIGGK